MESMAMIEGVLLTFLFSIAKRYVNITRLQASGIVLLLSFGAVILIGWYNGELGVRYVLDNFTVIFGTSQLVYELIIKQMGLDNILEKTKNDRLNEERVQDM